MPPPEHVCTAPGSSDHFADLPDFVALPINTFEISELGEGGREGGREEREGGGQEGGEGGREEREGGGQEGGKEGGREGGRVEVREGEHT